MTKDGGQDKTFIKALMPTFISEVREEFEQFEQLILQLEGAPGDAELLGALFRCAHTVKGSAGIFGLDQVVELTHHVETLLDRLRAGRVKLTPELGTLLLQSNDQLRALVAAAHDPRAEDAYGDTSRAALLAKLQAASGGNGGAIDAVQPDAAPQQVAASAPRRWYLLVHFAADTFRSGMDPLSILNYVRGLGAIPQLVCDLAAVPPIDAIDPENCHLGVDFSLDTAATREEIESAFSLLRDDFTLHLIAPDASPQHYARLIEAMPEKPGLGDVLVRLGAITREQLAQAQQPQQPQQTQRGAAVASDDHHRFIRVQADRLDAVINLMGELVIASAGASLMALQSRQGNLVEATTQISSLIEEIRNGTVGMRMVPISETFLRFRRVVRDTAVELNKDVELEIVGGETELDKSVVEQISDPLMHLVRNALDHGLETAELRLAAGKPAQGKLTLSACHESGGILIRIADDGRGIQRDKVLERAWERGLVERGVVPAPGDIDKLIFEAGFSTAEKVTNLSGRGVGMDVVRRNIEALRGSIVLSSEPGQGTRFDIRLPLTLSIIEGFLVGVGASKFIFPLAGVVEVIERRPTATTLDAQGRSVVELRGQVLPVVSARALYALDSPEPERSSVVVIQSATCRYGVIVDQLLGQHQTVIKPLGRMFRSLRGMSGSSILGNGEVALIFDVGSLGELAMTGAPTAPARDVHAMSVASTIAIKGAASC